MRFTTWNCRVGGFRRKASRISSLRPDVLVVPECEDLRSLLLLDGELQPSSRDWHPASVSTRGVGVLSYTGAELVAAPPLGRPIEFFVPLVATKGPETCQVAAVWTSATEDRSTTYRQAHEGLDRYRDWIKARDTVIMGDFNNATDDRKPWRELVERIEALGLVSAYHQFFHEDFGQESRKTYFHRGKESSTRHIDYCFIPAAWAPRIKNVEVGLHGEWSELSDHVPVTVDIEF